MDDFQFECRFYDDDATLNEAVRRVRLHPLLNRYRWFAAFFLACAAFSIITTGISTATILSLYGSVCYIFFALFYPRSYVNRAKKEALRLNNGTTPETVVRFGEQIVLTEGVTCLATDYAQIGEIRMLKHSCVLMTSKRTGIMFKPDSFTVGTYEDCLAFLKEKCVHLGNSAAIYGYAPNQKRHVARIIGMVMLCIVLGAALAFWEDGSLTLLPPWVWILAALWLAASVFLLAAPKSVFK